MILDRRRFLQSSVLAAVASLYGDRAIAAIKVTDPKKVVTDEVVLRALNRQNIDKDYVEHLDYAPAHPYSKLYRSILTGEEIQVVSALPMVKKDGTKIVPTLVDRGLYFEIQANVVEGVIYKDGRIDIRNDWTGDTVTWHPQLFMDGVEVLATSELVLRDVDPINATYANNVLEQSFGPVTRRIRVIEGRVFERWIIFSDPGVDIAIKHNAEGTWLLRYTNPMAVSSGDTESISATVLATQQFPFELHADATVETGASDGTIAWGVGLGSGQSWAAMRALGMGSSVSAAGTSALPGTIRCDNVSNQWRILDKITLPFNNSAIAGTVSAVVVSMRGNTGAVNDFSGSTVAIVAAAPSNPASLVVGDYGSFTYTNLATQITAAGWNTGAYNDFTLNATGISHIQASLGSYGTVGLLPGFVVDNAPPTWSSSAQFYVVGYYSEQGAGYKPKEVVTYTTGWTGKFLGRSAPARVLGTLVANISKVLGQP